MTNSRKLFPALCGAACVATLSVRAPAQGGAAKAPPATRRPPPTAQASAPGAQASRQAPIFEVDPMWPKPMPNHWLLGSAVGLAVDAKDHVFVVNLTDSFTERTETGADQTPPIGECCFRAPNVLEFDPQGKLVGHWGPQGRPQAPGEGFTWPTQNHGLAIDAQGNVWIGGSGGTDAQLLKFTREGKFIAAFGKPGALPSAAPVAPADTAGAGRAGARGGARGGDTAAAGAAGARGFAVVGRGGGGRGRGRGGAGPSLPPNSGSTESFGAPARIAFDESANEGFVADGFRNRRVAVIDLASGAVKRFWGAYGNRPDDAPLPAYNPEATAAQQFGNAVRCAELSKDGMVYVCDALNDRIQVFRKDGAFVKEQRIAPATRGEGSVWGIAFSRDAQQKYLYVADGSNMKVHVLDRQSLEELTSFGDGGKQPGQFIGVHSIAVDSKGNVYTAESNEGKRVQKFVFKGVGPVTKPNAGVLWPKRTGR